MADQPGYSVQNPRCDVVDCLSTAVVALVMRDLDGHTHVCAEHERIDREWADVENSWPLPCPNCINMPEHDVFVATPAELGS